MVPFSCAVPECRFPTPSPPAITDLQSGAMKRRTSDSEIQSSSDGVNSGASGRKEARFLPYVLAPSSSSESREAITTPVPVLGAAPFADGRGGCASSAAFGAAPLATGSGGGTSSLLKVVSRPDNRDCLDLLFEQKIGEDGVFSLRPFLKEACCLKRLMAFCTSCTFSNCGAQLRCLTAMCHLCVYQ